MVAFQVGAHKVYVGIVIILVYVTNITARTHLNNARSQTRQFWYRTDFIER